MQIKINQSKLQDIDAIFNLYAGAIAYQKEVGNNHWLGFERSLVEKEIYESRHFKVLINGQIACTFCIAYDDPLIWKTRNEEPAIYIHRIATDPSFRGNNMVKHIVTWAKDFAQKHHKSYVRLDTGDGNDRLINYYISCGFNMVGITAVDYTPDLPEHYKSGLFALFELAVA
jgi:ribosomal protein S18 acetylase RimI-like enzyme